MITFENSSGKAGKLTLSIDKGAVITLKSINDGEQVIEISNFLGGKLELIAGGENVRIVGMKTDGVVIQLITDTNNSVGLKRFFNSAKK